MAESSRQVKVEAGLPGRKDSMSFKVRQLWIHILTILYINNMTLDLPESLFPYI